MTPIPVVFLVNADNDKKRPRGNIRARHLGFSEISIFERLRKK
jgi:hypothetical protein